MPQGKTISCLKVVKMIAKGCLYHVLRVKDVECETPSTESVLVLREFPEVFPPQPEIDFGIDLSPDMYPILIPPYRMDLDEWEELKL